MSISAVDLNAFLRAPSARRKSITETVDNALQHNGFLLVRGHGVPADLMTSMVSASRSFFALPPAEKMRVAQPDPGTMRGYVAMGRESLSYSRDQAAPPDLNESFMIGQPDADKVDRSFAANIWPERPPEMKSLWVDYYREMERLAAELLRILATALALPESIFDEKFVGHTSRLRARHYPSQSATPQPGQLRAGAHTDYGSLAILLAEDGPGGLQVRQRSGAWVDVPVVDDCLIVNLGDLMARWTNDRWPAALHRVVNPPPDPAGAGARLSHIFFQSPSDDTLIESLEVCCGGNRPPKYAPVRAGEYLRMKFNKVRAS